MGILAVTLASLIILFVFFSKILFSLNSVYFSVSGDGIQSYFNTSYQIRHDTTVLYTNGINYPNGENYIYTQSQLPVVIGVKLISKWWPAIKDYTIGIMNTLMLFSIVLGAVFIFLIFDRLNVPLIISIPASVAIAGFSPQIDRMLGHFTLSLVWAIPLLIYLLILFHENRNKLLLSSAIGFSLFILATLHIYFVAFGFVISVSYLTVSFLKEKKYSLRVILVNLIYFVIQFVLPLLIYYAVSGYFGDTATERPSKPYGFLFYISRPESIFLPLGLEYGRFLHSLKDFTFIQWEGMAYIGLTAVIGFIVICLDLLIRFIKKRSWNNILIVTDKLVLNILFWASLILLAYSFGIPFIFDLEFLTDYIGPLKQLRAVGRFSWLFFYVINIVVVYRISQWRNQSVIRNALVVLSIILLFTDACYYLKGRQARMNNRLVEWNDKNDILPVNQMLSGLNAAEFQAILPLPFYHMGSESFNVPFRCDILAKACHVSLKTGLPIMAINSGRASVSQSVRNIAPVLEPYRELQVLKDMNDQKSFLVVSTPCIDMTEPEKNLIKNSSFIDSCLGYVLYRLDFGKLANLHAKKYDEIISTWKEIINRPDGDHSDYSNPEYIYMNCDTTDFTGYQNNSIRMTGRSVFNPYRGPVSGSRTKYYVSYWLNPVDKDLFPKARLVVELVNREKKVYSYQNVMSGDFLKAVDGAWGLVEYPFELEDPDDEIRISIYNDVISRKQTYFIDEVLIRPDSGDIVIKSRGYLMVNNRWHKIN